MSTLTKIYIYIFVLFSTHDDQDIEKSIGRNNWHALVISYPSSLTSNISEHTVREGRKPLDEVEGNGRHVTSKAWGPQNIETTNNGDYVERYQVKDNSSS